MRPSIALKDKISCGFWLDQQPGRFVVASSVPFHSGYLGIVSTQIKPPDQLPGRTRAVIIINQFFDINGVQKQLGTTAEIPHGRSSQRDLCA